MLIPSLRLSWEDGMGKPYSMDLGERVVSALKGQRRPAELIKCVHSN